jgi:hypothetical protein
MRIEIGPWRYQVLIAADLGGLQARNDYDRRQILLSSELAPAARLSVLLAQMRRAWAYHVGRPDSEDGEADLSATFAAAAMQALTRRRIERLRAMTADAGELAGVA